MKIFSRSRETLKGGCLKKRRTKNWPENCSLNIGHRLESSEALSNGYSCYVWYIIRKYNDKLNFRFLFLLASTRWARRMGRIIIGEIFFMDEIPHNPQGKKLRRVLKNQYLEQKLIANNKFDLWSDLFLGQIIKSNFYHQNWFKINHQTSSPHSVSQSYIFVLLIMYALAL